MSRAALLAGIAVVIILAYIGLMELLAEEPAKSDDKDKLQGVWKVTGLEVQGEKAPVEAASGVRFLFDQNTLHIHQGDEERKAAEFKLNSSAAPKTIDLTDSVEKRTVFGIYELDGDTLKLCLSEAGDAKARPTTFATKPGGGHALFVLRRDREGTSAEDK